MAEAEVKKKWRAYLCPECRLVFRVESGFTGRGVICRNCSYLLRLPNDSGASTVRAVKSQSDHA